jgi:hypothetical protein
MVIRRGRPLVNEPARHGHPGLSAGVRFILRSTQIPPQFYGSRNHPHPLVTSATRKVDAEGNSASLRLSLGPRPSISKNLRQSDFWPIDALITPGVASASAQKTDPLATAKSKRGGVWLGDSRLHLILKTISRLTPRRLEVSDLRA